MNMPGFTAEASAYITSNTYHGVYNASSNVQQIVTQIKCGPDEFCCQSGPHGICYECCDAHPLPPQPTKCGNLVCPPGHPCCGPGWGCCPAGAHCCGDGDGCCPDGSSCVGIFGWHFCLPI